VPFRPITLGSISSMTPTVRAKFVTAVVTDTLGGCYGYNRTVSQRLLITDEVIVELSRMTDGQRQGYLGRVHDKSM
jgi:hypothetical protein